MRTTQVIWPGVAIAGYFLGGYAQVALGGAASHAAPKSAVARGKLLVTQNRCVKCHGADLAGKPKGAPNIHGGGVLKEYNSRTFARLLRSGVAEDGSKVRRMPAFHLKPAESAAIYAYLKSLK